MDYKAMDKNRSREICEEILGVILIRNDDSVD